jgi:hypothetical protein
MRSAGDDNPDWLLRFFQRLTALRHSHDTLPGVAIQTWPAVSWRRTETRTAASRARPMQRQCREGPNAKALIQLVMRNRAGQRVHGPVAKRHAEFRTPVSIRDGDSLRSTLNAQRSTLNAQRSGSGDALPRQEGVVLAAVANDRYVPAAVPRA